METNQNRLDQFKDDSVTLIDAVVEQIQTDVAMGHMAPLEDLLMLVPEDDLLMYLLKN